MNTLEEMQAVKPIRHSSGEAVLIPREQWDRWLAALRQPGEGMELTLIEEGRDGGDPHYRVAAESLAAAEAYIAENYSKAVRDPKSKAFWTWTAEGGGNNGRWVRAERTIALIATGPVPVGLMTGRTSQNGGASSAEPPSPPAAPPGEVCPECEGERGHHGSTCSANSNPVDPEADEPASQPQETGKERLPQPDGTKDIEQQIRQHPFSSYVYCGDERLAEVTREFLKHFAELAAARSTIRDLERERDALVERDDYARQLQRLADKAMSEQTPASPSPPEPAGQ